MQNGLVPHPHVVDKNQNGYLRSKGNPEISPHQDPQPKVPVPRREVPITSGCKNQQESKLWKTETSTVQSSSSQGPCTYLLALPLSSSTGQQTKSHQRHTWRNLNCLVSGRDWGGVGMDNLLTDRRAGRGNCPILSPHHTEVQSHRAGRQVPYLGLH